jgi:hypothetical protein
MLGLWTALGIAIGAGLGVAMKNMPVWVGVGAALGIAIGILSSRR